MARRSAATDESGPSPPRRAQFVAGADQRAIRQHGMGCQRPLALHRQHRRELAEKIVAILDETRKVEEHERDVPPNGVLDEVVEADREDARLVLDTERIDHAARHGPPVIEAGRHLRHPGCAAVHRRPLKDHTARRRFLKRAHRNDKGIDRHFRRYSRLGIEGDPRRLDHIGIGAEARGQEMVLEARIGRRVQRRLRMAAKMRVEPVVVEILHEEARAGPAGAGDDEMVQALRPRLRTHARANVATGHRETDFIGVLHTIRRRVLAGGKLCNNSMRRRELCAS